MPTCSRHDPTEGKQRLRTKNNAAHQAPQDSARSLCDTEQGGACAMNIVGDVCAGPLSHRSVYHYRQYHVSDVLFPEYHANPSDYPRRNEYTCALDRYIYGTKHVV